MKRKEGRSITLLLALMLVLMNLFAVPAWAEPGDVAIDATNFPDSTFRAYVSANFDTNNDGILSQSELDAVKEINLTDKNIPTLKGVEHFKKLENLNCGYNQLTALDVSHNPALETLVLPDNQLTALDVSHNPALTHLFSRYNQLTALDVSHNPALQALECDNNQLTALDVSHNPALTHLACGYNRLTALDVSHNPELTELYCSSNKLTVLDVSHNPALKKLTCYNIKLTALDVSKNSALEYLVCTGNELTAIDVSHNPELTYLDCDQNKLTAIDMSHNPALKYLSCLFNQLTTLVVSHNPALTNLACNFNQLTAIDVSHNPELTYLNCSYNKLTNLDVSHNPALQELECYENRLTNLDLTANPLIKSCGGYDQEFDIAVGKNMMTFDLKSLPGNFDPSKASGWAGASVSGNTLKLDSTKPSKVTYTYEARPGRNLSVTLNVSYKEEFKISFDKNGGSGTMADVTKNTGETYVLPACAFTAPAEKEFKAWEVGGEEKAVGDSITVNEDTTVKAIWKDKAVANKSVIRVNPAGGKWADGTTTTKTYTVEVGENFTLPAAPVKDGYTFSYWKGSRYNPGDKYQVTGDDHTFTAVWEKNGVSDKTSPKTGDNGMLYVYALGLLVATSGMLILHARRNKKEE